MNFEQFFNRLKASVGAMSGKQLGTMAVAFVVVVGLTIGSAYYINQPTYGVLFSDLDPSAAATVVGKLKTAKVAYELDPGGRTVRVPVERIDELRVQYSSEGVVGSVPSGYELFDKMQFGVTDFQEHVNYRRALEGELSRTISTIAEVGGARVHIALPQPSLFTGREQVPTASVILKLRDNRKLSASTVTAITGMVSHSVEGLRPESVAIMDNFGRPLSKPTEDETADGAPIERQQRIEHDLTTRVVGLLEPIVGVGHVRVNVTARLQTGTEERTEERWDPTPVIRGEQRSTTTTGPAAVALSTSVTGANGQPSQGIAGTQANLPPDPNRPADQMKPVAAAGLTGGVTSSQTSETRNYELSKTTTHSLQPRGDVSRLSVAVLLDDNRQPQAAQNGQPAADAVRPRTAEDLQKIQALVSAAVGLDTARGDQLTVENIAFEETPVEEPLPAPGVWEKFGPQVFEALRMFGIAAIGLFAVFAIVRPLMKSATGTAAVRGSAAPKALAVVAAAAAAGASPRTVQDLEAEMDAQLMSGEAMKMPVLTRRMAALTQKEPENAARLLRTWLNED